MSKFKLPAHQRTTPIGKVDAASPATDKLNLLRQRDSLGTMEAAYINDINDQKMKIEKQQASRSPRTSNKN